ncbi:hypothetical protein Gpo141_00010292 [Globisporangium polare]
MSATAGYKLNTPITLGEGLVLKNRVVFAPLTRGRSGADRVPNENNEVYYEQRAGAGLIITEATGISETGYGWHHAAALYTQEHAAGWKRVVDRVHAKDGKIFLQMWHMGRQSHSSFNSKGEIVSSSAIRVASGHTRDANYVAGPYETPRALETDEVAEVVEDYRKSAELAKEVGFDGVEIHAANGYLIDQFLQTVSNKRTDKYGGSLENRSRFLFEIVDAVKSVWPADRIGVRVSPNGAFADIGSEDNVETFTYVIEKLSRHGLAYLAMLDGVGFGYHGKCREMTAFEAKALFKGTVIANNSYTRDTAEGVLRSGCADLVGFGRAYISNPDLAERFAHDWPLNPDASFDVYYNSSLGAKGYTDFPFYQPKDGEAASN